MAETVDRALRWAGLLFTGLFAGFLATVLIVELSARSFDGTVYTHVRLVELVALDVFATVLLIPALIIAALQAVLAFRRRSRARWSSAVVLVLLVLVLVTTLVINLPINADQLAWNPQAPPADWAQVRDRWQSAHAVRAAAALLAFGLLVGRTEQAPRSSQLARRALLEPVRSH
ncbi:anthrone oxygenase family protein [Amycolatopsis sp. H20-H5]|uniref:anthrone oxygenase family protein n=1 Tax=Amycolatopsis sp. H20-H5 TaxID=3046309 RepID=UPI002DBAE793|nr:anthrone oxygenase family protein [Amycolatopsis sp. H20-H5]MEC3980497.1 anthrone oxygenase family protein [Amycolatopsis sp. H20-H5]